MSPKVILVLGNSEICFVFSLLDLRTYGFELTDFLMYPAPFARHVSSRLCLKLVLRVAVVPDSDSEYIPLELLYIH